MRTVAIDRRIDSHPRVPDAERGREGRRRAFGRFRGTIAALAGRIGRRAPPR